MIVRKNSVGEFFSKVRIENSPMAMAEAVAAAGPEPEVVPEATFGWYWAAERRLPGKAATTESVS